MSLFSCFHISLNVRAHSSELEAILGVLVTNKTSEWRRQWQPTPVLLPGKFHGQRSLVGCSPWGCKGSTQLRDFTFTFHFHALEKEMATHSQGWGSLVGCRLWVAQSRTWLKWLSGSSSSSSTSGTKRERWLPNTVVTRVKKGKMSSTLWTNSTAGTMSNLRRLHIHSQLKVSRQIFKIQGSYTFCAPNTSHFLFCFGQSENRGSILLVPNFFKISCIAGGTSLETF